VITANSLPIKKRQEKILSLSIVFDCLKARLRMAEDIGVMSERQYSHIQENYIKQTGEMIGGWLVWADNAGKRDNE